MRLKTIKYLLLLVGLLISIVANAYDFEVGGIYYNKDGNCAIVTSGSPKYSGDLSIPSTVNYGGMEYSVTSIGDRAFEFCSGLTSVIIPNSVTSIGDWAFSECSGLTSVTIPNSVTSIGVNAFRSCSALTSVTIPNSVTSIGGLAFYLCSGLTSVTIGNSVASIGMDVFSLCSDLTSIKVESGNTTYDSRNDCNAIIETASNTLVVGCKNTVIPNSVTTIGSSAFWQCTGLTSVTIPNSVKSIGYDAFAYCSGLTSIKVESGNTIYDSRNNCNAIIKTASNTLVAGCKNTVIPNSVTSIGNSAFHGCRGLTSVTIPNSVKSIGDWAFASCSGLTSVTIPNSVKSIGDVAFADCSGLTSVTIPNSVTSIGSSAFSGCSGLTSVTIPNSVTSIRGSAFSGCTGLTSIKVESGNPTYDSRNDCNAIIETASNTLVTGCKNTVIPNSVTSIGDNAFSGCSGLTSVTIPNSVTSIGYRAFSNCDGLTSVTIPNSVTIIGDYAFYSCDGLTSVTIPNSVTSIGHEAFAYCYNLKSVISEIEMPFTIDSSVFGSGTKNIGKLTVPKGKKSVYQSTDGWKEFSNIVEAISSYTLTIQSSSGGYVSYNGANISATTKTFTIDEGSSATLTITPDSEYRLASLTVNGTNVTTSVSNNQYTISNITANTSVVATFEQIPVTGIEVNATNFPDEAFRNWVLQNVSGASDGVLTDEEIAKVSKISCGDKSISSLQGIECFTVLRELYCASNLLTSLDVSKNTALTRLSCYSNQLTSLDVSKNKALTFLNCHSNQLTSLDVSGCTALTRLECYSNQLTSLNVSKNTALSFLSCGNNKLTALDVSENTRLDYLGCDSNQLTGLNVSKNTALTLLDCYSNQLTSLDVSKNTALTQLCCYSNQLTSLDVSKNTALTRLYCYSNQLKSLDISGCTELTHLVCYSNQLTSLILSTNTAMTYLECYSNKLTSLDISNNTALKELYCYSNLLTDMDVSKNTEIILLYCSSNQLMSLDVSKNTALVSLDCSSNQLLILDLSKNISLKNNSIISYTKISPQFKSLIAVSISSGIAIPVPSDFEISKVSNLKLNGTSVNGSITTVDGQKYLVFAQSGTAQSTIDGKELTYTYSTGNKYSVAASMDVTVTLSYMPTTYSLSIQSGAGGSVSYDGTTITNKTQSFTVNEGTSATITISPNSGYRLSRLTVNGTNVTSNVSNNKYTINSITANTTVVATFEQIPATTYSLSIQSGAGGSVSYDGTTVTNTTQSFTVNEGTSATITITPNTGYRLSKLTVNGTNVTSSVKDNKYTINSISANTTVVVTFEQITYSLSVQATGNGTVTYNSTETKNKTNSFTVNHGSSATLSISPDNGYRLASLTVNGTNVTSSVSNNQYTIGNITANTTVVATFEQIPATTYSLSIQSGAGGSVSYGGTTITNKTQSFTIAEGSSVTIEMTPSNGYKLASLVVNGTDVTSGVVNNQYTISNITANTTVVVTYKAIPQTISVDGINYEVKSATDYTLNVGKGNYSGHVVIPATVSYDGDTWTVAGVVDGAFNQSAITAITWNPNTAIGDGAFGAQTNPNLLLYVKSEAYAPTNVQNVIANGRARKIVLTDAASGNDFNCPEAFTAEEISYTHRYGMTTGIGECRGWETIALPFDVKQFTHESKGTLIPFKVFSSTSAGKPFWLYRLTASGWQEAANIEANTPYIISLPNNKVYDNDYNLPGVMTFSSNNVTVPVTEVVRSTFGDRTFVANFTSQASSWSIYALNVNNDYSTYSDYLPEGSTFIRELRTVHPFEAYMTNSSGNAKQFFPLFETLPTAIREIPMQGMRGVKGVRIYSMSGELIMFDENISIEEALKRLKRGVYFVNGKKMVVK